MPALITLLGSLFGGIITAFSRLLSVETLKFIAWKALLFFIVFVALPVILYNVVTSLIFDFLEYALAYVQGLGINSQIVQITGIGAYIASKIQLVQSVTVFMTFVSIRFIMRFIPFLK